jgi:hypothetical protein
MSTYAEAKASVANLILAAATVGITPSQQRTFDSILRGINHDEAQAAKNLERASKYPRVKSTKA